MFGKGKLEDLLLLVRFCKCCVISWISFHKIDRVNWTEVSFQDRKQNNILNSASSKNYVSSGNFTSLVVCQVFDVDKLTKQAKISKHAELRELAELRKKLTNLA